jgi:CRISPR-associated protein Cmr4
VAENNLTCAGSLLGLHALTALHPGAGTALGTVDLPVQRERHTHWPTIAGSALKGILRDACREQIAASKDLDQLERYDDEPGSEGKPGKKAERKGSARDKADATLALNILFGPPTAGAGEFAGALSVTDARLLAFPVRSLRGVFAWVSCPAVLQRLERDAQLARKATGWDIPELPRPAEGQPLPVAVPAGSPCLVGNSQVVLEEFDFAAIKADATPIAKWIADNLLPASSTYQATRRRFEQHLLIVPDDDFTHFARHATEVSARIALDYQTKTVKGTALFYQEFLPAETLFYSVVLANASRAKNGHGKDAAAVLKTLGDTLQRLPFLQVGGDETTGKGLCAVCLSNGKE